MEPWWPSQWKRFMQLDSGFERNQNVILSHETEITGSCMQPTRLHGAINRMRQESRFHATKLMTSCSLGFLHLSRLHDAIKLMQLISRFGASFWFHATFAFTR